ncbi:MULTISPECIES: polyketide cyclase [Roseivirga]|jgi:hypothetical protein|uniref:polyketide cyclase n=1 Tax=Roseivirga TaxID=290180 RepID=UPI00257C4855|nr:MULTISPECIES: polyketide cyclase [Roseivirga]|tara:strand:+ start:7976 stop:8896 length:921 start_codon:yes stop_codon:yes gene_type:complete
MARLTFKDFWRNKSFRISIVQTLFFMGWGMVFLHYNIVEYAWVMFLVFPVILGLSLGVLPSTSSVVKGLLVAMLIFFVFCIVSGLEGLICTVFLIPLILPPVFLGFIIAHLFKQYRLLSRKSELSIRLSPLLVLLLLGPLEHFTLQNDKTVNSVSTQIILPYPPTEVFHAIKSIDTLYGPKPFLMQLDLPVPHKCILEREEVGAYRICYFEGGKIVEEITMFEPGKLLAMDVIGYELTGRRWLGFKEAIYTFDSLTTGQTRLTRTTTYTSELYPRAYWKPFEKEGIQQEHHYVFENLRRKLGDRGH